MEIGEIRFLTKVAEKSPLGLRLMLFKEKSSGSEKLAFIVKTASSEVDKLALSKMTWQVEQSKSAQRVVIVRMIILPEGAKEFFKSEAGLIMNDDKDRRSLESLVNQKSVEIHFFNAENEYNSRIELMTTYNMHKVAEDLLNANPIIDEGRMIIKSENLSENDIKNAMAGKIKSSPVQDKDLMDSIQKKMPATTNSAPKTKPEEFNKTSIRSNDIITPGSYGTASSIPPKNKKTELNADDLKKAISIPPTKITSDELLKSIPPNKIMADSIRFDTQGFFGDLNTVKAEDLMKIVDSIPPGKITPEDLLKSLPPMNSINISNVKSNDNLTTEELLKSLGDYSISAESNIKVNDLLGSIKDQGSNKNKDSGKLDHNNLAEAMLVFDKPDGYVEPKTVIPEVDKNTKEMKVDDLLSSLMLEDSPLKLTKEEENSLMSDLMSEATPLKSSEGGNSDLMKDLEVNIKEVNVKTVAPSNRKDEISSISVDDLFKALNGDS